MHTEDQIKRLQEWADLQCGWIWAFEGLVIVADRPEFIGKDEQGRMHNDSGPAWRGRDGWELWYIHGVKVTEQIVMTPGTLEPEEILGEENAEIRRIMIERFGDEKLLREADAEVVSTDDWGTLYRLHLPDDEPLVMVKVANSTPEPDGSIRDYFLRVPPDTRTPRQAIAWTFGKTEDEYAPLAQT